MKLVWEDDRGELFTYINNLRMAWFRSAGLYIVDLVDSKGLPNNQTKEFSDVREAVFFCETFKAPTVSAENESKNRKELRKLVAGRGFTVGNISLLTESEVNEMLRAAKAWNAVTEKMTARANARKVKVA